MLKLDAHVCGLDCLIDELVTSFAVESRAAAVLSALALPTTGPTGLKLPIEWRPEPIAATPWGLLHRLYTQ